MVGGGKYESIGNSIKELIKKEEKKKIGVDNQPQLMDNNSVR